MRPNRMPYQSFTCARLSPPPLRRAPAPVLPLLRNLFAVLAVLVACHAML